MKILITPNSFKECADSVGISDLINKTLSTNSSIQTIVRPLSDGGDGFLSVIKSIHEVVETYIEVSDGLNQKKNYKILVDKMTETAYLESASVIGLKLIEEKRRNPLILNSELIGKIINQLSVEVNQSRLKIKNLVIGIGGTATIDFGIGACSELGLSLFDNNGNKLTPVPKYFDSISTIKFIKPNLPFSLKCIVDVDTELIGEPGAIEIYGKQKGASERVLKSFKSGIKNILNLIFADEKLNVPQELNGAGGGLAAGLNIFFNAEIIRAEEFIKNDILQGINLDEIDAVITGEGSFDIQSFEGKGSGIILNLFAERSIPIFMINGSTSLPPNIKLSKNVIVINLIDLFESREESITNYRAGLAKAAQIVINQLRK